MGDVVDFTCKKNEFEKTRADTIKTLNDQVGGDWYYDGETGKYRDNLSNLTAVITEY